MTQMSGNAITSCTFFEMNSLAVIIVYLFNNLPRTEGFLKSDPLESRNNPLRSLRAQNSKNKCSDQHGHHEFGYGDGPKGSTYWPKLFKECGGERQSPINVEMAQLENMKVGPLEWSAGYFNSPKCMTLINNGHTLQLEAVFADGCKPKIEGGPLSAAFEFDNIHFHWGVTDNKGSEHTIDNYAYPMEMHVVHRRTPTASGPGNKIAVVAYFFKITEKGCPAMDYITEVIHKTLKHPGERIRLKHSFELSKLVQPFSFEYITYKGSLTTPPCTETVRWIMYPCPIEVSKKQLDKFREVCTLAPEMKDNFRPPQPLNNRTIYFVP